jgi:hypothetical protein
MLQNKPMRVWLELERVLFETSVNLCTSFHALIRAIISPEAHLNERIDHMTHRAYEHVPPSSLHRPPAQPCVYHREASAAASGSAAAVQACAMSPHRLARAIAQIVSPMDTVIKAPGPAHDDGCLTGCLCER